VRDRWVKMTGRQRCREIAVQQMRHGMRQRRGHHRIIAMSESFSIASNTSSAPSVFQVLMPHRSKPPARAFDEIPDDRCAAARNPVHEVDDGAGETHRCHAHERSLRILPHKRSDPRGVEHESNGEPPSFLE
jgi:hypothetical protein